MLSNLGVFGFYDVFLCFFALFFFETGKLALLPQLPTTL